MIQYYDIGLNLFCRQFPDPERILEMAREQRIACILTGSDRQEIEKIHEFLPSHPGTYGTAGIHPHNASDATPEDFDRILEVLATNPQIVAVGECGLDYNRMFSPKEAQLACLEQHLQIAEETGKPLFLHERDASDDLIHALESHPDLCTRAVVHCFTGDAQTMKRYLDLGLMIGITGWICDDRRAETLRDAAGILPLNRVMLETDAPYLTPKNVPGLSRTNVPENIRYVAKDLAYYMSVDQEELETCARENTRRFFKLPQEDDINE